MPASPYAIASGFACGAMVSFTPLIGLHFVLAIFLAYMIRGNFIAALIGTIVGNPITFPFIWGLIYKIGTYITTIKHVPLNDEINFDDNKSKAELVYEIRQWKMLLKENYNVRKGETVAIGILDVNHLHLTSIIACAELGLKIFLIDLAMFLLALVSLQRFLFFQFF